MQLNVQGKQMDVGDALRTHISDKLEAIKNKYFGRAVDADVTIAPEGHSSYKTHIVIRVGKNIHVVATAIEHEVYASFDHAAERIAKQLRRYKKRLRDHHERIEKSPELEIQKARDLTISLHQNEADPAHDNGEDSHGEPAIIAEGTKDIETLSVPEAVMRMDLAGAQFYMFKNVKTNHLNIIYHREDGNIGWVDPN